MAKDWIQNAFFRLFGVFDEEKLRKKIIIYILPEENVFSFENNGIMKTFLQNFAFYIIYISLCLKQILRNLTLGWDLYLNCKYKFMFQK